MKPTLLIAFLLLVFARPSLSAQEISCSSFCITGIAQDTVFPDIILVTIEFTHDSSVFINYPYISSVIDQSGDTIATGTLNFFGQFSNTSQDYPVTATHDSFPAGFEGTIIFHFNDSTICALPYPCLTATNDVKQTGTDVIAVYPNPFNSTATIQSSMNLEGAAISIVNAQGQHFCKMDQLYGNEHTLSQEQLTAGIYFLVLTRDGQYIASEKIVVLN